MSTQATIKLVAVTLLFALVSTLLDAAPFSVTWDAHPDPAVKEFRVYKITAGAEGDVRVLLATSTASPARIEADRGDTIAVTAWNGAESPLSEKVVIPLLPTPPAAPTGLRVIEIQTSMNLKDWNSIAYVSLPPDQEKYFVRARPRTILLP